MHQKLIFFIAVILLIASGVTAQGFRSSHVEAESDMSNDFFKDIGKSVLKFLEESNEDVELLAKFTEKRTLAGKFEKIVDTIFEIVQESNDFEHFCTYLGDEFKRMIQNAISGYLHHFGTKLQKSDGSQGRQRSPQSKNLNNSGTNILDHETPIKDYHGKTFLRENIPFIDIPDTKIQELYYYRWSTLARHLRYTTAGTGYILTEFVQPVWYAKAFGTIDAAAGHQIDEARWLRNQIYTNDYIQIYTRGPADSTQYTHWIHDAAYRKSQVDGDTQFLTSQLSELIRMWDAWEYTKDQNVGLYYYTPEWDAQERSLPGFVHPDNSSDPHYHGPPTYRPSINAYMVANARAIASVASQAGKADVAKNFTMIADKIQDAMYARLWDPEQEFFVDVIRPDNPNLNFIDGREEVGLFPFRFGIGLDKKYTVPSIQQLFDPQGFYAPYGPTTLEIRNKYFTAEVPGCCWWQGQSWPYSTSHVLKSMAAIHRADNTSVTADQYFDILSIYTKTQTKDGKPYIAESHFPMKDAWSGDSSNHSEHYDHSTYNDDVITGLLGIVPRSDDFLQINPIVPQNWTFYAIENAAYHGHLISYFYDADGTRYGLGKGLTVFVNGEQVYQGDSPNVVIPIPATRVNTEQARVNIAANPNGLGSYPLAEATYTFSADFPYKAIDGVVFYDSIPDNRWTNYQSPSKADTLKITFARPRKFSSITLALFSDIDRNGAIDLPTEITISAANGNITTISGDALLANDKNTFTFPEIESTFVAVTLSNRGSSYVGICELEVWVAPETGPMYYAVDAVLTNANVMNDQSSTATSNGAVVGGLSSSSVVAFSGLNVSKAGKQTLTVSYSNSGSEAALVNITVNQMTGGSISLPATGGNYMTVSIVVELAEGNNYLSLIGGNENIRFETINTSDI